jgi:hypothetical protein
VAGIDLPDDQPDGKRSDDAPGQMGANHERISQASDNASRDANDSDAADDCGNREEILQPVHPSILPGREKGGKAFLPVVLHCELDGTSEMAT